jgi:hypothetical protein
VRVEHGSHWADVSEEPYTWGQRNAARDAAAEGEFYGKFAVKLVTLRVTAWSEAGEPSDPKAWEAVEDGFGDAVFKAALDTWSRAPDPNDPSGEGRPSPSPLGSGSETQTAP